MQKIAGAIYPCKDVIDQLASFLDYQYGFHQKITKSKLSSFFNIITDSIWTYIEFPYVDKVYRSSFYTYFSTKHRTYDRNSTRISFFAKKITDDHFRSKEGVDFLQKYYLGYLTIRPTPTCLIGRTMLSPKALKNHSFECTLVETESMINGIKLHVSAFPYSSQDTETLSCAETTVWATMEYFGNKYGEYKPVLPATIVSTLSRLSYERQLPSHGLTAQQISFALKEFGFGTRIYALDFFNSELRNLFFHYIDSGIPFVATLENDKIGHAVVIIGQEPINQMHFKKATPSWSFEKNGRKISIIDVTDLQRKYVVMDDNNPPYTLSEYENPSVYYKEKSFQGCKITSLIVPLYPKIYLEAIEAKKLVFFLLKWDIILSYLPDEIVVRIFLTSSRSFKSKVAIDPKIHTSAKERILKTLMPKFIWIAELSNRSLCSIGSVSGLIVLDATEANDNVADALLFAAIGNKFIEFEKANPIGYSISLDPFPAYTNNLMGGF